MTQRDPGPGPRRLASGTFAPQPVSWPDGKTAAACLTFDIRTEAAMLDRGLRALLDVAGVRPAGYRAPMWEMNYHTPQLLAERGFLYDSSLIGSGVIESPAKALEMWTLELEAMHRLGACFVLCCHPRK